MASALLTFVALDPMGRPKVVPRLILETREDRLIFEQGAERAEGRRKLRKRV